MDEYFAQIDQMHYPSYDTSIASRLKHPKDILSTTFTGGMKIPSRQVIESFGRPMDRTPSVMITPPIEFVEPLPRFGDDNDDDDAKKRAALDNDIFLKHQEQAQANMQGQACAQDKGNEQRPITPESIDEGKADQEVGKLSAEESEELFGPSSIQDQDDVPGTADPGNLENEFAQDDAHFDSLLAELDQALDPQQGMQPQPETQPQPEMQPRQEISAQQEMQVWQQMQLQHQMQPQHQMRAQIKPPKQTKLPKQARPPKQPNRSNQTAPHQIIQPKVQAQNSSMPVQPQSRVHTHPAMALFDNDLPGDYLAGVNLTNNLDAYFAAKTVRLEGLNPRHSGTSQLTQGENQSDALRKYWTALSLRAEKLETVQQEWISKESKAWVDCFVDEAAKIHGRLTNRGFQISIEESWPIALDMQIAMYAIHAFEGQAAAAAFSTFFKVLFEEKHGLELANGLIWIINQANRSVRHEIRMTVSWIQNGQVMTGISHVQVPTAPYINANYAPMVLTRATIPTFVVPNDQNNVPAGPQYV
ncbi:hypothetical protein F5X68DRAFT_234161 [Plectosphaerella plurivora]|uniref:Uncharacterized protein n=1 Tax=Plectosphaerella plurivora TaxID=936078 RepID=A0A9P9A8H3_9PEZI|nr:hypothetical protein F5X68DRAFT_234161 [Plectosphaerella plurivora]